MLAFWPLSSRFTPRQQTDGFSKGWLSSHSEVIDPVSITSSGVPDWLCGTLIRNGPALFETRHQQVNHQFDGLSKLSKIRFEHQEVTFQTRFLKSKIYNRTKTNMRFPASLSFLPHTPPHSYINRLISFVTNTDMDNNNINVHRTWDKIYVTCDTAQSNVIDIDTLDTLGALHDSIDPLDISSSAHPQHAADSKDTINWLYNPMTKKLRLYRDTSTNRSFIGTLTFETAPLLHSFSVTSEYVILFHYPLRADMSDILNGRADCVVDSLKWNEAQPVVIYVMNQSSTDPNARYVHRFTCPAFYCMHTINAFESNDKIIVDLIAYDSPDFITKRETFGELNLMCDDKRRHTTTADKICGVCRRVIMDTTRNTTDLVDTTADTVFEMPTINPNYRCQNYSYVYGVGNSDKFTQWSIVKHNVHTGLQQIYYAPDGHYTGEPIFVPHPNRRIEDDGVILNLVLDGNNSKNYLLILDAQDMIPITNLSLPVLVPFDVHGEWIGD
jgi:carotenoid cleavage dioxygenase-like enzyme